MPTNLATLYALQNKTNPAREKAKLMAEGIKTIEPDKYGYSSIAKIPLMYMYGTAAGEASNIDKAQNEELSGLLKSTAETEALKAKSEAAKTDSEIAKNTSTIAKQEVETAAKMLDINKALGKVSKEAQIAHINSPEVKTVLRIPDTITITSITDDETGTWSVFDAYDTTDGVMRKYQSNNKTGEIQIAGGNATKGGKWMHLAPVPTGPSESDITNTVRLKYGVAASPEADKTVLGYDANKSPITTGDEIASTLGDKYSNYQKDVSDANIQSKLKSGAGVAGVLTPKPDDWVDWGHGQKKNKQTGEIIEVPTAPKDNAVTSQDRKYKQDLEVYLKYIAPAMKSDNIDEINRINNSNVGKRIRPEHLYTSDMAKDKKAGFWNSVGSFLGIGDSPATTREIGNLADAYAKGTQPKAVAPQVDATKTKKKVSADPNIQKAYDAIGQIQNSSLPPNEKAAKIQAVHQRMRNAGYKVGE